MIVDDLVPGSVLPVSTLDPGFRPPPVTQGRRKLREANLRVTDDGERCAVEYNIVRWGERDLPHQAGIAVFDRGPAGLLAAARIYDDVQPPAEIEGSAA